MLKRALEKSVTVIYASSEKPDEAMFSSVLAEDNQMTLLDVGLQRRDSNVYPCMRRACTSDMLSVDHNFRLFPPAIGETSDSTVARRRAALHVVVASERVARKAVRLDPERMNQQRGPVFTAP